MLGLLVSVCGLSCCGVLCIINAQWPLSAALWPIDRVESAAEPVGERHRSDWLIESVQGKKSEKKGESVHYFSHSLFTSAVLQTFTRLNLDWKRLL